MGLIIGIIGIFLGTGQIGFSSQMEQIPRDFTDFFGFSRLKIQKNLVESVPSVMKSLFVPY
jgi:hypothetical protein